MRSTAIQTADTLAAMDRYRGGVAVVYIESPGDTSEARCSAKVAQVALAERLAESTTASTPEPPGSNGEPVPAGDLVPAAANLEARGVNAYAKRGEARTAVKDVILELEARPEHVVLVVGNDPFLSWVIHRCGGRVTLERGELAALRRRRSVTRRWRWPVWWTIMEGQDCTAEIVREKIRSKMDVAKVFGALGVALLTFLLQQRVQGTAGLQSRTVSFALLTIGAGTALYFATLFAYDRLLMPTRFWMPHRRNRRRGWVSERPPSPDFWILYQNMLHAWKWLFIPGCVLVAAGLVLLGVAPEASRPDGWWVWLVAVAAVVAGWWWWNRPRLGATD